MKNQPFSLQFGGSVAAMLVPFTLLGLIAGGSAGASPIVRIGAQVVVSRLGAPTTGLPGDNRRPLLQPATNPHRLRPEFADQRRLGRLRTNDRVD